MQVAAIDQLSGTLCGDCAVRVVADQPATAELGVEARRVEADWFKGEWATRRVFAILRHEWQSP